MYTVDQVLEAIAPKGPKSPKHRLREIGAGHFAQLANNGIAFNMRDRAWNGARITQEPGTCRLLVWRSFTKEGSPYGEQVTAHSTLDSLAAAFNQLFEIRD